MVPSTTTAATQSSTRNGFVSRSTFRISRVAGAFRKLYLSVRPAWLAKFVALTPSERLTQVERRAIVALGLSPLLMMIVDQIGQCAVIPQGVVLRNESCAGSIFRASISAYYNMIHYEWYALSLAGGALVLAMNGLLRKGHWWNVLLGLALLGVLLFDKDGRSAGLHVVCAVLFFVGNVAVFLFAHWRFVRSEPQGWNSQHRWRTREMGLRLVLAGVIGAVMCLWAVGLLSLLFAEWLSLAAVCIHFFRDEAVHHEAGHMKVGGA